MTEVIEMLKSFRGGIHPDDSKRFTAKKPIEEMMMPKAVIIPVRQHIGAPCTPAVEKGDTVKKGQVIATGNGMVSSPVHASISGMVKDIADYPHPVYGKCLSICIESDGADTWAEGLPLTRDWHTLADEEMLAIIQQAGIVGMGGATFPAHVKLAGAPDKKIDTFILNAAECEPYLTADHRTMLENAPRIVNGVLISLKLTGAERGIIGIEDNKQDAIDVMKQACQGTGISVITLPVKYPQGAEKMLIKVITGREVPPGRLPMDIGVVVHNVGTAAAISDAVERGIPLIQRVTTVSGTAVREPKNLLVRLGTSFQDAIEACGGFSEPPAKIIMGGPMMGFAQSNLDVPVIKGVSGILALRKKEVQNGGERPCIRCGKCVAVCPCGLTPAMFATLGEKGLIEESKEAYHLYDCAECGSCVYVCPSKRNIVHHIRTSKSKLAAKAAAKK